MAPCFSGLTMGPMVPNSGRVTELKPGHSWSKTFFREATRVILPILLYLEECSSSVPMMEPLALRCGRAMGLQRELNWSRISGQVHSAGIRVVSRPSVIPFSLPRRTPRPLLNCGGFPMWENWTPPSVCLPRHWAFSQPWPEQPTRKS